MLQSLVLALTLASSAGVPPGASIHFDRPWARVTSPGQTVTAYVSMRSDTDDRLVSVTSPLAAHASIDITLRKGGASSLFEVKDGLALIPAQMNLMAPDGTQIVLSGLKQTVAVGDSLLLSLTFAHAGTVTIAIPVEEPGAVGPSI
jgi:copper(I)-binding protein